MVTVRCSPLPWRGVCLLSESTQVICLICKSPLRRWLVAQTAAHRHHSRASHSINYQLQANSLNAGSQHMNRTELQFTNTRVQNWLNTNPLSFAAANQVVTRTRVTNVTGSSHVSSVHVLWTSLEAAFTLNAAPCGDAWRRTSPQRAARQKSECSDHRPSCTRWIYIRCEK